jgi:hypothetical protein
LAVDADQRILADEGYLWEQKLDDTASGLRDAGYRQQGFFGFDASAYEDNLGEEATSLPSFSHQQGGQGHVPRHVGGMYSISRLIITIALQVQPAISRHSISIFLVCKVIERFFFCFFFVFFARTHNVHP